MMNVPDRSTSLIGTSSTTALLQTGAPGLQNAPPTLKFQVVFLFVCLNIHKLMTQERVLKIKVDPSFYS